ncbi:peptidoglycan D,D-transpeptidase FtsI family protein [Paenibacillus hexagrammi]|uniref:Penicillin-binding protein n=1 Tax=Paenibacillus hexagrammi TaxID=2908839 RepID=A0ABY3SD75_9BACL|nr:penicillin-binding transpeptidase domain-containing protein [Paenibacillus sp. YPD9-1]UJF31938.1 penicillin-binding protein [Paenibacillus sp. YPD9-1]
MNLSAREKRRVFLSLLLIIAAILMMYAKLFWIQVAASESYTSRDVNLVKNSVIQRQRALVLDSGRGEIYDRNMESFTGAPQRALVVFPIDQNSWGNIAQIAQLAKLLGIQPNTWVSYMKSLKEPQFWSPSSSVPFRLTKQMEQQLTALSLPYLKIVDRENRYPGNMTAKQLIGYTAQNPERIEAEYAIDLASGKLQLNSKLGESGLEKSFDYWLRGIGETSISYFTDGGKRPLSGLDARLIAPDNPYYPVKLVTTLDKSIQDQIEAFMDSMHIKEGAVVVQDVEQGDVIAMASRPDFNPLQVDLSSSSWSNHALKAIAPGSIFKTVVAAAALEEGVVDEHETFDCEGALGKYGFTCWRKEGHGPLTLEEGYAESCNIVFAKVMQRLTVEQLEKYASKLGLLIDNGWEGKAGTPEKLKQFDQEEAGHLFDARTPIHDEGVLMQTAIGQRDVRVTPLQASNMVVTLLHNGKSLSPRIVQSIRYSTDRVMEDFPVHQLDTEEGSISAKTSRKLLSWMRDVVTEGTGTGLQKAAWHLAGKSGTAQVEIGKQEKINQWFVGYGPVENPKYAVSVVVENVDPSASTKSIPLFKGVMDILAADDNSRK